MTIEVTDAGGADTADAGGEPEADGNGAIVDDDALDKGESGSEIEELKALSRKVLFEEGKKTKAKEPEAKKEPSKPKTKEQSAEEGEAVTSPAAEESEPDPDPKGIARILKQREQANATRNELRQVQEEIRAARESLAKEREALAKDRKEASAFLERLRKDPLGAVQEAGWDPDEFVLNASRRNDPGALAQREAMAVKRELEELKTWRQQQEEGAKRRDEEQQQRYQQAQAEQAKQGFLKTALDAATYPTLAQVYTKRPHLLVSEAERVANEYFEATKRQTGKGEYATWKEIAEYLESEHIDVRASPPAEGSREAPQAERAPGKRTLTPEKASERRSAPEPEGEATREELVALSRRALAGAGARGASS